MSALGACLNCKRTLSPALPETIRCYDCRSLLCETCFPQHSKGEMEALRTKLSEAEAKLEAVEKERDELGEFRTSWQKSSMEAQQKLYIAKVEKAELEAKLKQAEQERDACKKLRLEISESAVEVLQQRDALRVAIAGNAFTSDDPQAWVDIATRMRNVEPRVRARHTDALPGPCPNCLALRGALERKQTMLKQAESDVRLAQEVTLPALRASLKQAEQERDALANFATVRCGTCGGYIRPSTPPYEACRECSLRTTISALVEALQKVRPPDTTVWWRSELEIIEAALAQAREQGF